MDERSDGRIVERDFGPDRWVIILSTTRDLIEDLITKHKKNKGGHDHFEWDVSWENF